MVPLLSGRVLFWNFNENSPSMNRRSYLRQRREKERYKAKKRVGLDPCQADFYLHAESNRCIFGDASNRASEGQPNRALFTRGAVGPVATSSSSSGTVEFGTGLSGIRGTAHPNTMGPLVAPSSCIRPL